jgi:hypothetical protein
LRGAAIPPPGAAPFSESWMRRVLETTPGARGRLRDAAFVVRVDVAASDPHAVLEVARLARVAFAEPLDDREPRRIPLSTLAAWSRAPGPGSDSTEPVDERDGRWLWLGVLVLLGVEHVVRGRPARRGEDATASEVEVRVA